MGMFESTHVVCPIPTHESVVAESLIGCHHKFLRDRIQTFIALQPKLREHYIIICGIAAPSGLRMQRHDHLSPAKRVPNSLTPSLTFCFGATLAKTLM